MPNVVFAADNQIIANIVDNKIIINEQEIKLSETVVTVNDRTYLPLRNIAEVLGMDVEWDGEENKIIITYYDAEADQINLFPFEQDGLYGFMDNDSPYLYGCIEILRRSCGG